MKLDIDCVRDLLLAVEENTGLHKFCYFIDEYLMNKSCAAIDADPEHLPEYQAALQERHSNSKILYHAKYCVKAGLIESTGSLDGYRITVTDLSVEGHELLNNIRSRDNWEKIKEIALAAGSTSIRILEQAAANLISSKIVM